MYFALNLALAASSLALPSVRQRASAPSVTIQNGTIIGSSSDGVDTFNGIPFAMPPVGPLRLKPPQPHLDSFGTLMATATAASCPQEIMKANAQPTGVEDCLTLNVQRPTVFTSSAKLPVVAWIFGGGFEDGMDSNYDGTPIIQRSAALGHEIIYVAMNYRVGGFGFMAGKELQKDGSTNLGLRDQRLALEWIQENIAAFGGDPTQVTIWGESAGSISVFDQTIINGGDISYKGGKLFKGCIMDSGSIVPALDVAAPVAQNIYDNVVATAGCSGSVDTLECLRALPFETFYNATNSVPSDSSYRSLDLSYLPRPDPSNCFFPLSPDISVAKAQYAKVPIIIGDQEDEGTIFALSQSNITDTAELTTYIQSYFPNADPASVAGLVATYPDDPSAGSPFGTGLLFNTYPQRKRLAALLGDITFTLTRRTYLNSVADSVPSWSYLATYDPGLASDLIGLGVYHSSDLNAIYHAQPNELVADSIRSYYISFFNYQDPNRIASLATTLEWPQWKNTSSELIDFGTLSNSIILDNFRDTSYNYIKSHTGDFRV